MVIPGQNRNTGESQAFALDTLLYTYFPNYTFDMDYFCDICSV